MAVDDNKVERFASLAEDGQWMAETPQMPLPGQKVLLSNWIQGVDFLLVSIGEKAEHFRQEFKNALNGGSWVGIQTAQGVLLEAARAYRMGELELEPDFNANPVHRKLTQYKLELDKLAVANWEHITTWGLRASPFIGRHFPEHLKEFERLFQLWDEPGEGFAFSYDSESTTLVDYENMRAGNDKRLRYKKRLMLLLEGLQEVCVEVPSPQINIAPPSTSVEVIRKICLGFPRFAKQLQHRQRDRPPCEIVDEYDLQYLFHALLRLHFLHMKDEEVTPSYAGKSSRMDFLMQNDEIVLELKLTSPKIRDREIGTQLLDDMNRYVHHPKCKTLFCYVYDPSGSISKPENLEQELSKRFDGKMDVEVIISSATR